MKIYFGKYKGTEIKKIYDIEYLEWLVTYGIVKGKTEEAVREQLKTLKVHDN